MVEQTTSYGIGTTVALPYERAVERTREELAKEGFGVLTEIDVAAMDSVAALALTGNDAVRPLALDVRERLERVLERLSAW